MDWVDVLEWVFYMVYIACTNVVKILMLIVQSAHPEVSSPPPTPPARLTVETIPRDDERLEDDLTHDFPRKGLALSIETPGRVRIYVDGVSRKVAVVPVA
jgi:hypothetical protein